MTEEAKRNKIHNATATAAKDGLTDEDLLRLYLRLPKKERRELFADTAQAAELTDLSQRTIQLWIETGAIRAVSIGRKYWVYLKSLDDYLNLLAKKRAS